MTNMRANMSNPIVTAATTVDTAELRKGLPFEPAFFAAGTELLPLLPGPNWGERYAEHLGFYVGRHSLDLLAHVRRILLWAASGNREATYCAVIDLFQVLGAKGVALRRDILERVAPILCSAQIYSLSSRLAVTGTLTPLADLPASRFAIGSDSKLVYPAARAEVPPNLRPSPLEEAREYLYYGQVEEALRILEAALPQDPENADLQRELLEIYRHAGNLAGCQRMHRLLGTRDPAIEELWVETMPMLVNQDVPGVP